MSQSSSRKALGGVHSRFISVAAALLASSYAFAQTTQSAPGHNGAVDVNIVSGAGQSSGSNPAAGTTGAAVPGDADYTGYNSGGNLVGVSTSNPLPVSQQGTATVSGSVSVSNLPATQPVSGSVSVTNLPGTQAISGTVTSNQGAPGTTWPVNLDGGYTQANQGTAAALSGAWPVEQTDGTNVLGTSSHPTRVDPTGTTTQPVSGTFWQATQPISAASLPLPTSAATAANQTNVQGTAGSPATTVLSVQGVASGTAVPVSGTFWQSTQPVSAASLPLPTGAASSANQTNGTQQTEINNGSNVAAVKAASTAAAAGDPALVVAVSPNNSVAVTGTFWQTTQPVSGTVTANQGTANATPWNENLAQVGGSSAATGGASGSLAIGGTVATNTAPTQNPVVIAAISQATGSNPSAGTSTRTQQIASDVTGNQFVMVGGPNTWTCTSSAVGTSKVQCEAAPAAGLRAYISSIDAESVTATSNLTISYGTGTNCGTTNTVLWGPYSLLTTQTLHYQYLPGIVPATATEICVLSSSGTDTITVTLTGYIAP